MRRVDDRYTLSATDLSNFLNCRYRTALDVREALGEIRRPHWHDPLLDGLIKRGLEHERQYVETLRGAGKDVVSLAATRDPEEAVARTIEALRRGIDVVVQGALGAGCWYGRPDLLLRVDGESALGPWRYEVADTKLALETRAGTIVQLGLYCALLEDVQGVAPEWFSVVTPDKEIPVRRYRTDDYAAYFRLLRRRLEEAVASGDAPALLASSYPEPVDHCDVCHWAAACRHRRRADDHLSLVAGISRVQRAELEGHGITTVAALAKVPAPLPFKTRRGAGETYVRLREQARVQIQARETGAPVHELILPIEPGRGLCKLPPPSPGDLFLDLEGDPYAGPDGREYLFGLVSLDDAAGPRYTGRWALTDADEARAFDAIVDAIMTASATHPEMHVYHYAPYEPAALKRLMGRFARRQRDIDALLRGGRFVDLYAIVRQGVRAGVERYSIKSLEPLYGFTREVPLLDAGRSLRTMEQALELGLDHLITPELRAVVEGYNRDDCLSALRLRDWLESLRETLEASGQPVPRFDPETDTASENVTEREQRVEALRARLLEGIPAERAARDPDQQARWLLAYLLDWHRREDKATWWEYFRLRDLPDEDLFDEPQAVAGLELVERVTRIANKRGRPTGSVVDRYRFPPQEMEIRRNDELKLRVEQKLGVVERVDRTARTLDIRKGPKMAEVHPSSCFAHTYFSTDVLEDAIAAIGAAVAEGRPEPLARRLLRADPPMLASGPLTARTADEGEAVLETAVRTVLDLQQSVLAIQGPPGAGKTFTGARMICALVRAGRRVGVTATSHAVIRNLLDAVADAAREHESGGHAAGGPVDSASPRSVSDRPAVRLGHKLDSADDEGDGVREFTGNADSRAALESGDVNVLGGTAWLWARDEFARSVDVLFVDEAGQMSLANVLAVTRAADSLVLLGDPQQLEQPRKGTHPEGAGVSALEHMLGGRLTVEEGRGLFLPETWRLPPSIVAFTSAVFYEGRLHARAGLERQAIAAPPFAGNGLWVIDVDHHGNRSASDEEVAVVEQLVSVLTKPGSTWTDHRGDVRPLTCSDILVVAPFNAHVSRLGDRLEPRGVRVGTVDRFQGQEAPVVIYSMATSQPEDAPRGLEFLYSLNRLNVATSRARGAAFLVASRQLCAPDCRTPRHIRLANALCRYREMASVVDASVLAM